MEVTFRSRQPERRYRVSAEAMAAWGAVVGRRYVERVEALFTFERLADLYRFRPLGSHPLTGDRRGQFALRLTGRVKLIISAKSQTSVIVEEVVDYHE